MRTKCFLCNSEMNGRGKGGDLHRHNGSAHADCLWRAGRDYAKIKNVVIGIPINYRRTDDNNNTR